MGAWLDRPKTKAADFGRPMRCAKPTCTYRFLKLPGSKMPVCPNDGSQLVPVRKKASHG